VCVEIVPIGESACELTLTHERLHGEHVTRTEEGWNQILDELVSVPGQNNTEMEARVGGLWTIIDRRLGTDYKAIGEYLEIERPHRLTFTFGMPQFSEEFSRVTIEIVPAGAGCFLTGVRERVHSSMVHRSWYNWMRCYIGAGMTTDFDSDVGVDLYRRWASMNVGQ
jgi:hypothetical protein